MLRENTTDGIYEELPHEGKFGEKVNIAESFMPRAPNPDRG